MSTTAAIAASTAANAAAVSANAARNARQRAECRLLVEGFQSQGATVSEMKAYSSCVARLHPDPPNQVETAFFKVAFVAAVLCMIVGAGIAYKEHGAGIAEYLFYPFFGFVVGGTVVLFLGLLVVGFQFLLS